MKEELSDGVDPLQQHLLDVCEYACNNQEDGSLGLDEAANQRHVLNAEIEDYLQPERE